ncbi:hypothetical protein KAH37_06730 [bacterium]|nr:hypothetical protein [bacterium]
MISRRLTTLLTQWKQQQTPTLLIQILNQAINDEEYQLISDMIGEFQGVLTPEMRFFAGEALAKLDKKEEAFEHLLAVLESNPNHYKAKLLLDELGYQEETEEESSDKQAIKSFKDIMIPATPITETASYRSNRNRYIAVITVLIVIGSLLMVTLFWHKNKDFFINLEEPEATLYPLSWHEYQLQSAEIKQWVSRHKASENSRRASFYLSAFALIDNYLGAADKDLLSKVRFYFALTKKKSADMQHLNTYIEQKTASKGVEYFNMLESHYPKTLPDIMQQKIVVPKEITRKNIRKALYDTLMLLRQNKLKQSLTLVTTILKKKKFPNSEMAQKLLVLIQANSLKKDSSYTIDKEALLTILKRWKTESPERHLLSEAWATLGTVTDDIEMVEEGFYLGCPGSFWCDDTITTFLTKKEVSRARRMAEYMKSKRGINRQASDIILVLKTAFADDDFGSCYFSYKELKQFFPATIDSPIAKIAAICSENNGYYEEAEELYRLVGGDDAPPIIAAKIEEMSWLVHEDDESLERLKEIYKKNSKNIDVLQSYLTVVTQGNDIRKTIELLDTLFDKVAATKKRAVINHYIAVGAISRVIEQLETVKSEPWAQDKLHEILCSNMQFPAPPVKVDAPHFSYQKTCDVLIKSWDDITSEKFDDAIKSLTKEHKRTKTCDPALFYLLAEAYRHKGESQLTFAMIDSMLECNKHYLPGLVFTAGIAFYQGDLHAAEKGIKYILAHEDIFSVKSKLYHNELVLIQADMLISRGKSSEMMPFLRKNIIKGTPIRQAEREKFNDLYDKLKPNEKARLMRFIKRSFKTVK